MHSLYGSQYLGGSFGQCLILNWRGLVLLNLILLPVNKCTAFSQQFTFYVAVWDQMLSPWVFLGWEDDLEEENEKPSCLVFALVNNKMVLLCIALRSLLLQMHYLSEQSSVLFSELSILLFNILHRMARDINCQFLKMTCDWILLQYCRHSTDREVALMMLMAYLSYMLAEVSL